MHVFLYSGAALVLSVIGVRLLRGSYSELSRQHIIFIFTLLFFNFDYEHYSESLPLDYFVISLVFYKVGGASSYCRPHSAIFDGVQVLMGALYLEESIDRQQS